jgi:hypothetical protein
VEAGCDAKDTGSDGAENNPKGLGLWVENVAEAAAARAEEERRQAVMCRIMARIVQRNLSQALDA